MTRKQHRLRYPRRPDPTSTPHAGRYPDRVCFWCGQAFTPRWGGSQQMYCRAACRAAYHKAAHLCCERAIADGRLTVQDLRNAATVPYTPPECSETALPLSDIAQGYTECPGALLRFLVEVERGTVASLVKLGVQSARTTRRPRRDLSCSEACRLAADHLAQLLRRRSSLHGPLHLPAVGEHAQMATQNIERAVPHAATDQCPPCPCCGGRMIIVEVFARDGAPRGPPSSSAGIGS